MKFHVLKRDKKRPKKGKNEVYLIIDHWNDFSFVTKFNVHVFDENGNSFDLDNVKIGFKGQTEGVSTHSQIESSFEKLPKGYFSLGTGNQYYADLGTEFSDDFKFEYLTAMRDIVFDEINLDIAMSASVFKTSLLRSNSLSEINGQFKRYLSGNVVLTDFDFFFEHEGSEKIAPIELDFVVEANSKPSTNIHAIIGRNGIGKTTILNEMINTITNPKNSKGEFLKDGKFGKKKIRNDYFSSLISISFSAFDPFSPPVDQPNPELGTCYYYIGLKDCSDDSGTRLKELSDLHNECVDSLVECLNDKGKKIQWENAIKTLESDENFAEMQLLALCDLTKKNLKSNALELMKRMSSGHAIVLLTISKLVARVGEKTLVLLDEPESHLHPPLLSAFTRALSQLLYSRNGVAIVASHSPVVLQEIPSSCVWKITRSRLAWSKTRPSVETFGENVGVLTREVFGLEVTKSGFHTLLEDAVSNGWSYDETLDQYNEQLGYEAKAVLRSMIAEREKISSKI